MALRGYEIHDSVCIKTLRFTVTLLNPPSREEALNLSPSLRGIKGEEN